MAKDADNEKKNWSVVILLEYVTLFIVRAYDKARRGVRKEGSKLYFQYEDGGEYLELGINTIHELFNKIYRQTFEGEGKDSYIYVRFNNEDDDRIEKITNYIKDYMGQEATGRDGIKSNEFLNDNLQNLNEALDECFLEITYLNDLKNYMADFIENRKLFYHYSLNEYPSDSLIDKQVLPYYKLLSKFLPGIEESTQLKDNVLKPLLLLGIDNDYNFTLSSPIVMSNVKKMYKGIIDFYKKLFSSLDTKAISGEMARLYRSILIAKMQRIFRWYSFDDMTIRYVACVPRPVGEQKESKIVINSKKLSDINSYEGIGELRLAEKIYNEYCLRGKPEQFKVALVGDINEPVVMLIDYVNKLLNTEHEKKFKIVYNVYTKNNIRHLNNPDIGLYIEDDIDQYNNILTKVSEFKKLIDYNDAVFLLDDKDLYEEPMVKNFSDSEALYRKFSSNSFDRYNDWAYTSQNIFVKNPMDDIYQYYVTYILSGRFGEIKKDANANIIRYLTQNEEFLKSTIYIYVSDLEAFNSMYFKEKYNMRIEQYNEKKIGIIKFSNKKENALANSKDCYIVLSIWQIIKHLALEDRDEIVAILNKKYKTRIGLMDLHNLYIGLFYQHWRDGVEIYYQYDASYKDDMFDVFIQGFINDIFMEMFKNRAGSMYLKYCRDVIISFLYGDANSIEDMLFIHLLKRQCIDTEHFIQCGKKEDILKYREPRLRFSDKRLYDLAMQYYDVGFVGTSDINNIETLFLRAGKNKKQYIKELVSACETLAYTESSLYRNCCNE